MRKLLLIFSWLLILLAAYAADDVFISKSVPATAKLGDIIQVNITVTNRLDYTIDGSLEEIITGAETIEPTLIYPSSTRGIVAARPPYVEWNVHIPPGASASFTYKIRTSQVGRYNYDLTTLTFGNFIYDTGADQHTDILCNNNSVCETKYGETVLNCPNDCHSGAGDTLCQPTKDGVCDPDCVPGADPDCSTEPSLLGIRGWVPLIGVGVVVLLLLGGLLFAGPTIWRRIQAPKAKAPEAIPPKCPARKLQRAGAKK